MRRKNYQRWALNGNISSIQRLQMFYTYSLVIDNTPWKTPEVPPRTGSNAKSNPTAQSFKKNDKT